METAQDISVPTPRSLSVGVFLLIYSAPALFVWLVLRRGYSSSLRQGAFAYAFFLGFLPLALFTVFDGF
jgi:hypothetical protein